MANISGEEKNIKFQAGLINKAISNLRGLINGLKDGGSGFTKEVTAISKSIDTIVKETNDAVRRTEQDN
jgi:hypothetical protein